MGSKSGVEVADLDVAITVPIGMPTLGTIFNVIRKPFDEKGNVPNDEFETYLYTCFYDSDGTTTSIVVFLLSGIPLVPMNTSNADQYCWLISDLSSAMYSNT